MLRFTDPNLEKDFLQQDFRASLPLTRGGLLLGVLLILVYFPMDELFVPEPYVDLAKKFRVFAQAGSTIILLVATFLIQSRRLLIFLIAVTALGHGLSWNWLYWVGGASTAIYYHPAVIMVLLISFFVLSLPFRISFPMSSTMVATFIAIGTASEIELRIFANTTISMVIILSIATYGAYQREYLSRQSYLRARELAVAQNSLLIEQQERLDWLKNMTGFLRHEMKNALIGISSSLALASRSDSVSHVTRYISRAEKSMGFMRKILNAASNATSLEDALSTRTEESCNLLVTVREYCFEMQALYPRLSFDLALGANVIVPLSAEHVVQILDKLVNNALEHTAPDSDIQIKVGQNNGGESILSVANLGDPLPADLDALFSPFVSTKRGHGHGNLGLGLYIVRTIVEARGGRVEANPLPGQLTGAQFIVTLPCIIT